MKTTVRAYRFDLTQPEEKAAWEALKGKLGGLGLTCFETHGGASHYRPELEGREVTLETSHLFSNQWNTAPVAGVSDKGLRLFDWAKDYPSHLSGCLRTVARGHWLEQTDEMREVRRNTNKCGYCGKQEPAAKGYVFCPHCLDSEYLKETDLHLTRMVPIDRTDEPRAPLTEAERGYLLPLYREAQLHGSSERGRARVAKARRDIETKYREAVGNATAEHDGMLWLMDHGIKTDNVIYYSHTKRFCFGWREPLGDAVLSGLLEVISEFPFAYDIKTAPSTLAGGRTLSGE